MQIGKGYDDLAHWLSSGRKANAFVIHPPGLSSGKKIPAPPGEGFLGVYSSGSTGKPKLIWWNLKALHANCSRYSNVTGWTWATCFQPWSFAGAHLACQAHISGGKVLSLGHDWQINHSILQQDKPQALSATPTFINLLIQSRKTSNSTDWSPRQISIGGEILHASTGTRIQSAYPSSRITLIYGSAEAGVIAKTTRLDGWYPLTSIQKRFDDFKFVDDQLFLKKQGQWTPTHDLCEIRSDHFKPVGRLDRIMNIGGEKVSLDEIESLAESFPEVRRASANSKPNAVVGQIVSLKLEAAVTEADDALLETILHKMRKKLSKPAWPRWCEWGNIQDTNNGKKSCDTSAQKYG